LNTKSKFENSKLTHFTFSLNSAYAIYDNQILAWIPDSENLFFDRFEFLSRVPVQYDSIKISNLDLGSKKIIKIFCSNNVIHSLSVEGIVFSWGVDREKLGLLALGYNYNQPSPIPNTNFTDKIIEISLSEKHAAATDGN
jgi:hypothetical protein